MDDCFGDDVGVETVAEVDGVDVIAFEVRIPVAGRVSVCGRPRGGASPTL